MADDSNPLASLLGGLTSATGAGLSVWDAGNTYSNLQNALQTIGPTQLNPYSLTGPGGMSSGFNTSGAGNINLGSLQPSFNALTGVGSSGAGGYNTNLIPGLVSSGAGAYGTALGALSGAAGGNYNLFGASTANGALSAANNNINTLGQTYNGIYNNTLSGLQQQAQPGILQSAYGLQNTLFGNGVMDGTGAASGALAAQNFGRGVGQADASYQLAALQAAQSGMASQAGAASTLAGIGNSTAQTGQGLLSSAFNNFGNTSQLLAGLNTSGLNNGLSALQGAGALNTLGLNNYNSALQTAMAQATARNQSLFPYASVAAKIADQPTVASELGSALSQNASGIGSGMSSLFNSGGNLLSGLFGSGGGSSAAGSANPYLSSGFLSGGGFGGTDYSPFVSSNSGYSDNGLSNGTPDWGFSGP